MRIKLLKRFLMNRISILVMLFLTNCFCALSQESGQRIVKPEQSNHQPVFTDNTLKLYTNCTEICFDKKNTSPRMQHIDTLSEYYKRSTGIMTPTISDGISTYNLTGSNPFYEMLGSRFKTQFPVTVQGVLIGSWFKQMKGQETDMIPIYVFECGNSNILPYGNEIGKGYFTIDNIDTSSSELKFSYLPIKMNVESSNFAVMIVTSLDDSRFDSYALCTNNQGDGKNEKSAIVMYSKNDTLHYDTFSDYFYKNYNVTMKDGNPPNFDLVMIPIVETDMASSVGLAFEGITLNSAGPNPANDRVNLNLTLDSRSSVTVNLVGLDGGIVGTITRYGLDPGTYDLGFDLKNVPSGAYFYTVITDRAKFGGKLSVIK